MRLGWAGVAAGAADRPLLRDQPKGRPAQLGFGLRPRFFFGDVDNFKGNISDLMCKIDQ